MEIFVPDLMANGTASMDRIEREIRRGAEMEKVTYETDQLKIHDAFNKTYKQKYIDGLGQPVAAIRPREYFRAIQKDQNFWEDKSNFDKFIKDNPACKITCAPGKTMVTI